jgi:hypothetical protein
LIHPQVNGRCNRKSNDGIRSRCTFSEKLTPTKRPSIEPSKSQTREATSTLKPTKRPSIEPSKSPTTETDILSAKYHNLEAQNIEYRRALFSTKEFSHRDGKRKSRISDRTLLHQRILFATQSNKIQSVSIQDYASQGALLGSDAIQGENLHGVPPVIKIKI